MLTGACDDSPPTEVLRLQALRPHPQDPRRPQGQLRPNRLPWLRRTRASHLPGAHISPSRRDTGSRLHRSDRAYSVGKAVRRSCPQNLAVRGCIAAVTATDTPRPGLQTSPQGVIRGGRRTGGVLRANWHRPSWPTWRAISLALGSGAAGFIVATLVFQPPTGYHPDWGDFPTWLAFIAAAVAGGVALTQLKAQQDQINAEAERNIKRDQLLDSQLQEAQQRALTNQRRQGEQVRLSGYPMRADGRAFAQIVNDSERPIRDVACRMMQEGKPTLPTEFRVAVNLPGPPGSPQPDRTYFPAKAAEFDIASGQYLSLNAGKEIRISFAGDPMYAQSVKYVIHFTDDADVRWQLDDDMRLTTAPDEGW